MTGEQEVQMIVSDLDGTLLGNDGRVPEANAKALKRACDSGIRIAIASGRLPAVCSRIALDAGLKHCGIVGMNGAQIWDSPFGQPLREASFTSALAAEVVGILQSLACIYNVYTIDGVYTNRSLSDKEAERFRGHFAGSGVRVVISPDAGYEALKRRVVKFLVKNTGDRAGFDAAKCFVSKLQGIYLTASAADNFEIMLNDVGKDEGVCYLAQRSGFSAKSIMAFGDYDNDIPMLKACGFSVAMGNAQAEVKAVADYITCDHAQAGVAAVIDALLDGRLSEYAKRRI